MTQVRPTRAPALRHVRRVVKQTLFSVGYYHQRLSQLQFRGAAILCYHGIRATADEVVPFNDLQVSRETFERHCQLIAETCNPISLDDLRAACAGQRPLPARAVLMTFDDGYRSVLDHALPALERYGIPAAVFVCAAPVLGSQHFWFDALCRRDGEQAVLRARTLPYHDWLALTSGIDMRADDRETHRPMTHAELRRLAASSLVEIGGHTMSHPNLALVPVDHQRREISGCRSALQEAIGRPITGFAYPFGRPTEHYSADTVGVIRDAGFDIALTTKPGFATEGCDPFEMLRFVMLESVNDAELAHRLAHSWHAAVDTA